MKTSISCWLACGVLLATPLATMAQTLTPMPSSTATAPMILVTTTDKLPEEVVDAVKAYAQEKKWLYMGDSKAKGGEVTMVKVCIPAVGQILWPLGLHLSALLPCGNLGVYSKQGKTEISMLHPRYMQVLYPAPEIEKAVALAAPLLTGMLEAVAK